MPVREVPLQFPVKGVTENSPNGVVPAGCTQDALNVRPFDVTDERLRGGQRPGTSLASEQQIKNNAGTAEEPIQRLVLGINSVAPSNGGFGTEWNNADKTAEGSVTFQSAETERFLPDGSHLTYLGGSGGGHRNLGTYMERCRRCGII